MIFEIRDLKTEFMENPMGMDCAAPRFLEDGGGQEKCSPEQI